MENLDKYQNLILNMQSGLLPENLSGEEIVLLREVDGEDWFYKLGYTEDKYKKPKLYLVETQSIRAYNNKTGEELLDWRWDNPKKQQ